MSATRLELALTTGSGCGRRTSRGKPRGNKMDERKKCSMSPSAGRGGGGGTCQLRKARRSPVQRRAQRREAAAAEGRSERPPAPSSKGGRGPLRSHHLTHATRCWCGTPTPPWTRPQSRARGASRAAPSPAGSEGGGRASTGEPKRGHHPHFFGCGFARVQDGNDSARLFITSSGSTSSRICRSDKEGV